MTFEERVTILSHIGWGGFLTLSFGIYLPISLSILLTFVIATVKESLESLGWAFWEPGKPPWSSGLADVLEFLIGIVAAAILLLVHARVGFGI